MVTTTPGPTLQSRHDSLRLSLPSISLCPTTPGNSLSLYLVVLTWTFYRLLSTFRKPPRKDRDSNCNINKSEFDANPFPQLLRQPGKPPRTVEW
ncbi:hypothetical protein HYPSUDRAFT_41814 [Hypholoma sublateritium FD-334 SS-4]|uniref:Uncharacterized protein n=1 Tax=Hypholoma sublateritium (strain FD-334 SS-4) TaxID=945553 RepID=A0A0D2NZ13_HYPSF|nr:hypothetical protein HYPSUDRAFT_41814 [Hypholoma sublateritium FD-334 SS-4]